MNTEIILAPMLVTFLGQRLYLHFVHVRHVHLAGYVVHHLFFGVLIQLPAAFYLAFGQRNRTLARAALVLLVIGSAMILDEIIYLVMTKATDGDYVSAISLTGAVVFISLATLLLLALYRLHRDQA